MAELREGLAHVSFDRSNAHSGEFCDLDITEAVETTCEKDFASFWPELHDGRFKASKAVARFQVDDLVMMMLRSIGRLLGPLPPDRLRSSAVGQQVTLDSAYVGRGILRRELRCSAPSEHPRKRLMDEIHPLVRADSKSSEPVSQLPSAAPVKLLDIGDQLVGGDGVFRRDRISLAQRSCSAGARWDSRSHGNHPPLKGGFNFRACLPSRRSNFSKTRSPGRNRSKPGVENMLGHAPPSLATEGSLDIHDGHPAPKLAPVKVTSEVLTPRRIMSAVGRLVCSDSVASLAGQVGCRK